MHEEIVSGKQVTGGLAGRFMLGAMSASVALSGEVGVPTINGTKIELEASTVACRDRTFIVGASDQNVFLANIAFVPNFGSGLRIPRSPILLNIDKRGYVSFDL